MSNKEITNPSIRMPRSLKKKADEKAKERGFESIAGKANFSAYVRYLIEEDLEEK